MTSPLARFITMPHSHYCEKARWALDRVGLAYVEEVHAPLFHGLVTVPNGGRTVPLLIHEARRFVDSSEILLHLDHTAGSGTL